MLSCVRSSASFIVKEWEKDGKATLIGSAAAAYLLNVNMVMGLANGVGGYILGEAVSQIYRSYSKKDLSEYKDMFGSMDSDRWMKDIHSRETKVFWLQMTVRLIVGASLMGVFGAALTVATFALALLIQGIDEYAIRPLTTRIIAKLGCYSELNLH